MAVRAGDRHAGGGRRPGDGELIANRGGLQILRCRRQRGRGAGTKRLQDREGLRERQRVVLRGGAGRLSAVRHSRVREVQDAGAVQRRRADVGHHRAVARARAAVLVAVAVGLERSACPVFGGVMTAEVVAHFVGERVLEEAVLRGDAVGVVDTRPQIRHAARPGRARQHQVHRRDARGHRQRQRFAGSDHERQRRRARQHRAQVLNQILSHYGLRLDDWHSRSYVLSDRKGKTVLVQDLGALWPAAQQLAGRPLDPLDPRLLAALRQVPASEPAL